MINPLWKNIPLELQARPNWVWWKKEERNGKTTKIPKSTKGGNASTTNPDTWSTFDQACDASDAWDGDGIGFVFTAEAGYVGLDIDHASEDDQQYVSYFDTYAEKSQSGEGIHIIMKGILPEAFGKKEGQGRRSGNLELYDRGRYFVFTGDVIHPQPILDCQDKLNEFIASVFTVAKPVQQQEVNLSGLIPAPLSMDVLTEIEQSAQGQLFQEYWSGSNGPKASASEADAGLLAILRWWTRGDQAQSIALFKSSPRAQGERAQKINRPDYLIRTWNALSGPVRDEIAILPPVIVHAKSSAPWRKIDISHVEEAISGTILEPIVTALRSPALDLLPLELGLAKALALCGCALSARLPPVPESAPDAEGKVNLGQFLPKHGHHLAKLKIMTGGGSVSNFWVLAVGKSGSGKDIGNLMSDVTRHFHWSIGTSGSEEGIADAFVSNNNGIIEISEMKNWLDQRHWQHRASSFLTDAFNKGFFSHALSKRGEKGGTKRETDYCYPNVIAAIQPGVLQAYASSTDLDSGFLGRFLIIQVPSTNVYPSNRDLTPERNIIITHLNRLRALQGEVTMPDYYSKPLITMFDDEKAEPEPTWRRIANEYSVRLGIPCSISAEPGNDAVGITPDGWQRAQILAQYFFKQAEEVFGTLHFDPVQNKFENLMERIKRCVQRAKYGKIPKHRISQTIGKGSKAKERDEAIRELLERGLLVAEKDPSGHGGLILSCP